MDCEIGQRSSNRMFHHVDDLFCVFEELFVFFEFLKRISVSFPTDGILFEDKVFFSNVDLAELISEIHEDLFLFALDFISILLSDFFHGLRVWNTGDEHLVFNLLADSSGKVVGAGDGPWFAVNIVCNVGDS